MCAYLDAVWPRARPEEIVAELPGEPAVLESAAAGILAVDEQKALLWTRPPRSWKSARWSAADLVLLDEVAGLVEHPEGYGHVVVDVPPARSLRGDGEVPIREASDLPGAVVDAVREALQREGSIGVVAADADVARVREALGAAGLPVAGPEELGARVAVVPATVVKGLEYDHVVAVEPASIAEAEERGCTGCTWC